MNSTRREITCASKPFKLNWRELSLLFLVALGLWLPRTFRLDKFVATDEVVWLWRSANFYYALGQRDFAATYLNSSPGVVTMWVETFAFLLEFPQYRGLGQGLLNKYALMEELLLAHGVHPHKLLVTSRVLMVLLNTTLLVAAFYFARRLFGTRTALMGFALIALDPFHIAVTRLAHLDGPLSSFLFLSLLSFLAYLEEKRLLFLLVSAVVGGLAVLAKLPGWMIIPTLGLEAFLWYLWSRKSAMQSIEKKDLRFGKKLLLPMCMWGIAFLVTILAIFPAMWVEPTTTLKRLVYSPFNFVEDVAINSGATGEEESNIEFAFQDQPAKYFLRYPLNYIWQITPFVLLGLGAALVAYVSHFSVLRELKARRAVVVLLLFVVVYTALLTLPPKSSNKYYIPVYPALDLISGLGWVCCADLLSRLTTSYRKYISASILIALIIIQAVQVLPTFPYYFTYFNPLLGGSRRAAELFSLGSGEGLDLAAEYLNSKPKASKLKVMSWYGIGPFSYYFVGKTVLVSKGTVWGDAETAQLKKMDYLVTYHNQWRRFLPTGLSYLLVGIEPEHRIWINGIEYARIYNVKAFPPEKFSPPQ